jgi:hypothetical protein
MQAEQQLRTSVGEINDLKAALDEHTLVPIADPQGKTTCISDKSGALSKFSREEFPS